jgi:hypothetical protein
MSQIDPLHPGTQRRLLSPIERVSEVLFGLIMALTFTCTISVLEADRAAVREMLIGAIGCNIAWGLVDAIMFLMMSITEKGRNYRLLNFVRKSKQTEQVNQVIADALPVVIADVLKPEDIDAIRKKLILLPDRPAEKKLKINDFKMSLGIFILVFLSTFPVALPFIFIAEVQRALRLSNAIAIVLMFLCGWILGRYAGRNRFMMGLIMSAIGIALVLMTIALGG